MSHVLVTGANRGLGLEFARQLLARGERVVATCRQPGRAQDLNRLAGDHPGHLVVLPLVLPEPRSIAELARELDTLGLRIGLLVNNAGAMQGGERFGTLERDALRASFDTNAAGPLLLTQALVPLLTAQARIVNLSSRLGSIALTESFHTPGYAIGKAALNMATRLLSIELGAQGKVVVAMSPGWVRTDMGGAQAPLSAVESVAAMLAVIDALAPAHNGGFFGHHGEPIAW